MQRKSKPKNKRQFIEMLMREYGYSELLAKDAAAIVAGHGAFPDEPKTSPERLMIAAQAICEYSHDDSDEDYQEAVAELREALAEAQSTCSNNEHETASCSNSRTF